MNNLYKSLILIISLLGLGVSYYIYKTSTFVTAEFKNLRPFHSKAPIYYNGFNIGRVVKVRPNKEYTATIVTLWLHPHDLKLPVNVSANLKKERNRHDKKFDYIDIVYPEKPSGFYLKDGDKIAGKTTVELDSYLSNMDPDSLDSIKADFAESVQNLNVTLQTLGELFATLNSMAEEVKPDILKSSSNLSVTTDNIVKVSQNAKSLTDNINNALPEDRINTTAKNVQIISKNVKVMSNELNKTMPQIKCTVCEANRVLENVEEMTAGLNCTMKKPFGGLRLIFGSPICKNKCK